MDLTTESRSIDPTEVRSDGFSVSAGEKRPAEDDNLNTPSPKKARSKGVLPRYTKKVAEIVLVLAALGKMRAGRSPTAAEREMMAEARRKLVELCQGFSPKEVFPMEAFVTVIEDLSLSKIREESLGFCPPKMSIAEKLLLTKHQMEKSAQIPLYSAPCSTPAMQTKSGAALEPHALLSAGRMFPLNKASGPMPSGGLQPASPLGYVSTAKSTSLAYQLPNSEVRPVISSVLPTSNVARDSSSLAKPRVERQHFRLDGRSNGSSYTSQVQVSAYASGDHTTAKTPTWSVQHQPSQLIKFGPDHKMTAQTSAKVEGSAAISMPPMARHPTASKSTITQTPPKNPASTGFKQGPSMHNTHYEIGKIVKELLLPQIPVHSAWTPPSRDYMTKALACQICKLTINELSGVLVCDGCDKGYHLKCLHNNNQKAIPRGEWHCTKCLSLNNGKPLPPKYGRVMRSISAPKLSSSSTLAQSSLEKKVETSDGKVNQQGITENGNFGLMISNVSEVRENGSLASGAKINDRSSGTCPNNLIKDSGSAAVSPSVVSYSDRSCKERLVTESDSQPPAKSGSVVISFDASQAPVNIKDNNQTGLPESAKVSSQRCLESDLPVEGLEKSVDGTLKSNPNHETKVDERGSTPTNPVETSGTCIRANEQASSSSDDLHSVDWAGDFINVVDEKTYYHSCCINGVVYKVQDHALLLLDNKLLPSKLQAMWEDSITRLKWVAVNRCYFPADLLEGVVHPFPSENNEVYESTHVSTVMAGLIQGPCKVIHPNKSIEEGEMGTQLAMGETDGQPQSLLCKWSYDESKGLFRSVSS